VVLSNFFLVIAETNHTADGAATPVWIRIVDWVFLFIYMIELGLKLIVMGRSMFNDFFTVFDVTIVGASVVLGVVELMLLSLPSVSVLRIVRLLRLGRSVRVLKQLPVLHMMLRGLYGVAKPLLYGIGLLGFVFLFWGVLAVTFFIPSKQGACGRGCI